MNFYSRSLIVAASLIVTPIIGAMAQSNPSGAKDNKAQPSMSNTQTGSQETGSARNRHVEGATGKTIVPGNESTVAGDKKATSEQKTGIVR